MKYSLKVKELKNRQNFFVFEPILNVIKFLSLNKLNVKEKNLLFYYFFRKNNMSRTSVSFIHNRCVVSFRHVLYFVCLKCLVIK